VTSSALQNGRFSVALVGLGLVLALTGLAEAQAADQDLMAMPLEDLARVQVYSASRHSEDVRKAPSSVSVITSEDIRRYGWRTLGEALRSLRGFYTTYDRQYTYLGIRGFLRPGDFNSRILLLVNGHRYNEDVYDSASFDAEYPIDLNLVDHIEVVRGPGSSMYGTNAVFGVINVITRQPGSETVAEVAGTTGTFLQRTARATLQGRVGGVSGLLSATLDRNPGAPVLFFPEFAVPETNNGYAESSDGGSMQQGFADFAWGGFRVQGMFGNRVKVIPTASYGMVFNDPADSDQDTRAYVDVSDRREVGKGRTLSLRAYYDVYNYVGRGDYAEPGNEAPVRICGKARADWVGTEATLTWQAGTQTVIGGASYERDIHVTQRSVAAELPDMLHIEESPWLVAAYGELELHALPKTILHAGGRLDHYSTFGTAFSPRLAAIWTPGDRTSVKYIFAGAFRAPSSYEEFYADGMTIEPASRPLQPERIRSNELVFERSLAKGVRLTVDGYHDRLEKLIDQSPDLATGLTFFTNVGRVSSRGLEVEMEVDRPSGWSSHASYTATATTDDLLGKPLENSPPTQVKVASSLPLGRWATGSAEVIYVGPMTDYRQGRLASYVLPNVTFASRPLLRGWLFSSSLYNALDRRWNSPAGPNDPESEIQMDGRSWRFQVGYRLPVRGGRREP
jgi:outer membrane receptor for ferrienterochelin and colicins